MFWKQTIKEIHNWQGTFDTIMAREIEKVTELIKEINELKEKIKSLENDKDALIKSNENYKECIEEIQKHEEAIAAIISSDRKDINAIINIIKKLQTKGKK